MRIKVTGLMLVWACIPMISQAAMTWSGCVTVTGVSNYIANNNMVILALSPDLPACVPNGISGATFFVAGTYGVTSSNVSSFLASGLLAYSTGMPVMVYYDTASCAGALVSNGGYAGQC